MPRRLPTIKRGEVITANFLSALSRSINEINNFNARRGNTKIPQTGSVEAKGVTPEDQPDLEEVTEDTGSSATGKFWTEVSRTEETVRVENPDDPEQYVDVGRLIVIVMQNELGEIETRTYSSGTG